MSTASLSKQTNDGDNLYEDDSAKSLVAKKNRRFRKSRMNMGLIESPVYDADRMDGVMNGIVQNIRIEMDKHNMTLSNLAELAGVDCAHLSRVFKGTARVGLTVLIKVAYVLEISPGDLFPYDFNTRKTNGQRFDEITKELDISGCNYLLLFCADYVKEWRRIRGTKGQ